MATQYPGRPDWPLDFYDPTVNAFSGDTPLPAPDTEPYAPAVRTTGEFVRTIRGDMTALFPEIRANENPIVFQWTRLSGSSLVQRLRRYIESGTGLRVWSPMDRPVSGAFIEVIPRARPGFASGSGWPTYRHQVWDVSATFQPYNCSSGGGA